MAAFRIIQDGLEVASVSGPNREKCFREIWRYAEQYAEDGSAEIKEKVGSKWVAVATLAKAKEEDDVLEKADAQ